MASVHDLATYMLRRQAMSAMKLQKLAYYGQAWHLARTGRVLFPDPIEAWANGPVVRALYETHRGRFGLSSWPRGSSNQLAPTECAVVDEVLDTYGRKSAHWLSEQTHLEKPWREARRGLPEGSRSSARIDPELMRQYYSDQLARGQDPVSATQRL